MLRLRNSRGRPGLLAVDQGGREVHVCWNHAAPKIHGQRDAGSFPIKVTVVFGVLSEFNETGSTTRICSEELRLVTFSGWLGWRASEDGAGVSSLHRSKTAGVWGTSGWVGFGSSSLHRAETGAPGVFVPLDLSGARAEWDSVTRGCLMIDKILTVDGGFLLLVCD